MSQTKVWWGVCVCLIHTLSVILSWVVYWYHARLLCLCHSARVDWELNWLFTTNSWVQEPETWTPETGSRRGWIEERRGDVDTKWCLWMCKCHRQLFVIQTLFHHFLQRASWNAAEELREALSDLIWKEGEEGEVEGEEGEEEVWIRSGISLYSVTSVLLSLQTQQLLHMNLTFLKAEQHFDENIFIPSTWRWSCFLLEVKWDSEASFTFVIRYNTFFKI